MAHRKESPATDKKPGPGFNNCDTCHVITVDPHEQLGIPWTYISLKEQNNCTNVIYHLVFFYYQ